MLTAALLANFNMCRGNAAINHWQWLVLAGWVIYTYTLDWKLTVIWFYIVIIVTIIGTKPLLHAGQGEIKGILNGFMRNSLILPALWVLHSWIGLILILQPLWYWLFGKLKSNNLVRFGEGFTGLILGWLICN